MTRMSSHDVRERLLEAGVRIFSKSGFNGCSVQDITESAGVPKGSFYNHFDSKEALGAAALKHYWSDGDCCDRLQLLNQPGLSPRERLRAYFEQISADVAQMSYTCGCLIGNMAAELSDHSPLISSELSEIYAGWSRMVGQCLREAQEAGEVCKNADPDQVATFILNAWEGAVLRARIEKGDRPLRQFLDTLFSQLLR